MKEKEFEIRGRPELLGLGRYPVPSYGGVSMGIIRVKYEIWGYGIGV